MVNLNQAPGDIILWHRAAFSYKEVNKMKTLHMIGNAHLDLAWLWPWQEGFGEVKATFLSALQRLDEFEGFIFTSSSTAIYLIYGS